MKVQIYNDVLPSSYLKEIQNLLTSNNINWFYYNELTLPDDWENKVPKHENVVETPGMAHLFQFYEDDNLDKPGFSSHWNLFWPIKFFMEDKADVIFDNAIRTKANMLFQSMKGGPEKFNVPHVDYPHRENTVTVLFFPFDSDGDFFLFEENHKNGVPDTVTVQQRITPKENTMLIFDGWQYHASSNPIKYFTRISLNWVIQQ